MDLLKGPTEEQLKIIKQELNEDDERFAHNLELFEQWILFQGHLPKNYDARMLPTFLRGCKHDLERAKRKFEMYFSAKSTVPEIFSNRDATSEECIIASKTIALVPLKDLNTDGSRVSVYKLTSSDTNQFNIAEIVRKFCILGDIRLAEEKPISGDIIIMDCANNLTATHVAKTVNYIVGKAMTIANEAYPQRMKKLHVVNLPEFGEKLISLLKSFTKEKIRNRFIIHKNPEELLQHINPDILPTEYGGKAGSLATMHENWQQYFIEKNDWLKQQEKIVCVGPIPKNLLQSCALDSNEGLQGSFRKLAID